MFATVRSVGMTEEDVGADLRVGPNSKKACAMFAMILLWSAMFLLYLLCTAMFHAIKCYVCYDSCYDFAMFRNTGGHGLSPPLTERERKRQRRWIPD